MMKALRSLAAAAAFFFPVVTQAQEVTTGAWTTKFLTSTAGHPMCLLRTTATNGDVLFIKISSTDREAYLQIGSPNREWMQEKINANLMVDGFTHWRIPFTRYDERKNLVGASADRKRTIDLLVEIAVGNRMTVTYENGESTEMSLHGSMAAVKRFAGCVAALEGSGNHASPRAPVPPPADNRAAPVPQPAGRGNNANGMNI